MSNCVLCNFSFGETLSKNGVGKQLISNDVWRIAYDQNRRGQCDWNNKARVTFKRCWCFLSTMSFCWGVSTHVVGWMMSVSLKNWCIINSAPLSNLTILNLVSNCLSTWLMNALKSVCVSTFEFKGKTHTYLVWSSTIVRKYLWPCIEGMAQGP